MTASVYAPQHVGGRAKELERLFSFLVSSQYEGRMEGQT